MRQDRRMQPLAAAPARAAASRQQAGTGEAAVGPSAKDFCARAELRYPSPALKALGLRPTTG